MKGLHSPQYARATMIAYLRHCTENLAPWKLPLQGDEAERPASGTGGGGRG